LRYRSPPRSLPWSWFGNSFERRGSPAGAVL
jgi:hypothetical protein